MTVYDIPASQRDNKLPMVVHLLGDEALMDSFTFDAEQAMELLGIKRSRLTQISGRELRVGRIRKDRYLRPVYRECDLRDYQEWTRATATHQSSSRAIEQAIDSLDDRFNDLFVVVQERLQQSQEAHQQLLDRSLLKIREFTRQDVRQERLALEDLTEGVKQSLQQQLQAMRLEQSSLRAQLRNLECLAEQADLRLASYHQDLRELVTGLLLLRKDVQDMREVILEERHSLQRELTEQLSLRDQQEQASTQALTLTITSQTHELSLARQELAQARAGWELKSLAKPNKAKPLAPRRRLPYSVRP